MYNRCIGIKQVITGHTYKQNINSLSRLKRQMSISLSQLMASFSSVINNICRFKAIESSLAEHTYRDLALQQVFSVFTSMHLLTANAFSYVWIENGHNSSKQSHWFMSANMNGQYLTTNQSSCSWRLLSSIKLLMFFKLTRLSWDTSWNCYNITALKSCF